MWVAKSIKSLAFIGFIAFQLLPSCKEEFSVIPTITTTEISYITSSSARCKACVISDGGSAVTAKGIVWSTTQSPTIETNLGIVNAGSGTGEFSCTLTGLSSGNVYYVRSYATNSMGTSYGNEINFTAYYDILTLSVGNIYYYTYSYENDIAITNSWNIKKGQVKWTISSAESVDNSTLYVYESIFNGIYVERDENGYYDTTQIVDEKSSFDLTQTENNKIYWWAGIINRYIPTPTYNIDTVTISPSHYTIYKSNYTEHLGLVDYYKYNNTQGFSFYTINYTLDSLVLLP